MTEYDAAEKLLSLGGQNYMFKRMDQGTIVGSEGFHSESGLMNNNRIHTTYVMSNQDSSENTKMAFDDKQQNGILLIKHKHT